MIQIDFSVQKVTKKFKEFLSVDSISFENFNTTLFLVGSEATLPINLYLQVRDSRIPVINAISFLLIAGTSAAALFNLYFSKEKN